MSTSNIDEFDRLVRQALAKSLSQSRVQAVVDSAMLNIHPDTPLVASILRHHRKATPPQKLPSFYLVDAIAREAGKRAKRALKEQSLSSSEPSTSTSTLTTLDYAAFINELEGMLAKIVLDSWENGEQQHREKVRKILEIWQKGGVFSSSSLSRIHSKMAAFDQQSAGGANGSASLSTSTTPPLSPPPGAYTNATQDHPTSAPSGLPASVLALFGGQSDSTSTSSNTSLTTNSHSKPPLSIQDEVARAIAGAKSGVFLPNEPTPYPPPAIASSTIPPPPPPAPSPSTVPFNPSQLALLESLAKPTEPLSSGISYPAAHSTDLPDYRNKRPLDSLLDPSSSYAPSRPSPYAPSTTANPSLVAPPPPPPGFKPPIFLPTPQLAPSSTPAPVTAPTQPQLPPSTAALFDPTTFSALSPASWTSLVRSLRPTLFSHLTEREPTNGEVMAFVQMVMMRQQQAQKQMMMAATGGMVFGSGTEATANGYASQAPMPMPMRAPPQSQMGYENPPPINQVQSQDDYSGAWPSQHPSEPST